MTMQYCSLAEVRQHLQIEDAGYDKFDAWLTVLIQETKQAIDDFCGRPDGFRADGQATPREFAGSGSGVQWIDEAARVTKVEVKDSATDTTYVEWASTDWIAGRRDPVHRPRFGDRDFEPYTWVMTNPSGNYAIFLSGRFSTLRGFAPELDSARDQRRSVPTVRVTANWGYSMDTPPAVKLACLKQVALYWQRGKTGESDSSVSPELGITVFRRRTMNLDQDVAFLLKNGRLVKPPVG